MSVLVSGSADRQKSHYSLRLQPEFNNFFVRFAQCHRHRRRRPRNSPLFARESFVSLSKWPPATGHMLSWQLETIWLATKQRGFFLSTKYEKKNLYLNYESQILICLPLMQPNDTSECTAPTRTKKTKEKKKTKGNQQKLKKHRRNLWRASRRIWLIFMYVPEISDTSFDASCVHSNCCCRCRYSVSIQFHAFIKQTSTLSASYVISHLGAQFITSSRLISL